MNKKYGRKKGVAEEKAWQPPNKETIKIHNKEAAKVSRKKKKKRVICFWLLPMLKKTL